MFSEKAKSESDTSTASKEVTTISNKQPTNTKSSVEEGGLETYTRELQSAWNGAFISGDRTELENLVQNEGVYVEREVRIAQSKAERNLDLADKLKSTNRSPETDSQWLTLLTDLNPGPYSQYLIEKTGDAASSIGPVRNRLLVIQARWKELYGNNIIYAKDLKWLEESLKPKESGLGGMLTTARKRLFA